MPAICRPARADDIDQASRLVVASLNDLAARHGFEPFVSWRPPAFTLFSLNDDPGGLWVTEESGRIVGFAFAWASGDFWFLAQLFVSPECQGQGIGNTLIERVLDHARASGAANKALITFAFNRVSQGLYMRHGFFPRTLLYNMAVPREVLAAGVKDKPPHVRPIEDNAADMRILAGIDARALGLSREKHHRFLLGEGTTRGIIVEAGGACAGYAYITTDGQIGPAAAARSEHAGAVFTAALAVALEGGSPQVSAFVPGASEAMLRIATDRGMRIVWPTVLMSERDFGNWSLYAPRNPGFM